ncbi:MAG TPA: YwiC-like family protein [Bryobacteraceae bacterium]|nr:YwiC-like family protein [Bryobacteraceae bacterium]
MATTIRPAADASQKFVPREHGATAMLLIPFFAAAILLRQFYWTEIVALAAVVCAFAIKDPLVVLARQRFVWKQEHPETKPALRSALLEFVLVAICGLTLLLTRDWRPFVLLFLGAGAFTVLAVAVNVRNRQRSEWFQVASAVALSSTSVAVSLSGPGRIASWVWLLWLLTALQAAAGIFVVHARLDARIAARKGREADTASRRAAFLSQAVLLLAAVVFTYFGRFWIAAALLAAAAGYLLELRRQKNPASLQMSLKRVGQEALTLSIAYSLMVIAGLWQFAKY